MSSRSLTACATPPNAWSIAMASNGVGYRPPVLATAKVRQDEHLQHFHGKEALVARCLARHDAGWRGSSPHAALGRRAGGRSFDVSTRSPSGFAPRFHGLRLRQGGGGIPRSEPCATVSPKAAQRGAAGGDRHALPRVHVDVKLAPALSCGRGLEEKSCGALRRHARSPRAPPDGPALDLIATGIGPSVGLAREFVHGRQQDQSSTIRARRIPSRHLCLQDLRSSTSRRRTAWFLGLASLDP